MTNTVASQYDLIVSAKGTEDLAALQKSVQKFTTDMQAAQKQAGSFGKSANDNAKGFQAFGQRVSGVSMQVQDIAVQLQMGTSVTRTLSQQLPQLASNFGVVGAVIGTVVGIAIPFIARFVDIERIMRTTNETLDATAKAFDAAAKSQEEANTSIGDLTKKYGTFALQVHVINQELADLDARKALDMLTQSADALLQKFTEIETISKGRNVMRIADEAGGLAAQLHISREEADGLIRSLRDIQTGTNLEAAIATLTEIGNKLLEGDAQAQATGRSLLEMVRAAAQLQTSRQHVDDFTLSLTKLAEMAQTATTWLRQEWSDTFTKGLEAAKARIESFLPAIDKLQKSREQLMNDRAAFGGYWTKDDQAASDAAIASIDKQIAAQGRNTEAFKQAKAAAQEYATGLKQFQSSITQALPEQDRLALQIITMRQEFEKFHASLSDEDVIAYGQAIAGLQEQITKLSDNTKLSDVAKQLVDMGSKITENFSSGLVDALYEFASGAKSAQDAFGEFARQFLIDVAKMITQALVLLAIKTALAALGTAVGGPLGGIISGIVSGLGAVGEQVNAAQASFASLAPASTGGDGVQALSGSSTGGQFAAGTVIPANHGSMNRLRGSLGDGKPNVTVNVNNSVANAQVRTRQRADGGIDIDVLEKVLGERIARGGSPISKGIETGYALRRAGR